MAQEANGLPYASNNQTGTGAVYFNNGFLDQHNKNLDMLTDDPFIKHYRVLEAEEQKKARAAKMVEDITKDLSVDYKGAMPEDIKGTIEPLRAEILSDYGKLLSSGVQANNIQRNPEYQKILAKVNGLKSVAQQSAEWNKAITTQAGDYAKDPSKYNDNFASDVAGFRLLTPEQKAQAFTKSGGIFLQSQLPNLQKQIDDTWQASKDTIYDIDEKVKEVNGVRQSVKEKKLNDDKVWALSSGFALNNATNVDRVFNALPPLKQQHYADAANVLSQAKGQTVSPKDLFVYESFKPKAGDTREVGDVAFTPERNEKAGERIKQEKANGLYDAINAIAEGNPDAFVKTYDGKTAMVNGKFISTNLNGLGYGTRQIQYATEQKDAKGQPILATSTVPNTIISVAYNPATPDLLYLRTDEDAAKDPTGREFGTKVPKAQFAYQLFNNNYKDAAEAYTYLQKAAGRKERNDVTGQGVVNPNQTTSTGKMVTNNVVSQYQPEGLTGEGVPVGKKQVIESQKNTVKEPIKLAGSEAPETLVVDQVYILQGDKVRWNGKNLVKVK